MVSLKLGRREDKGEDHPCRDEEGLEGRAEEGLEGRVEGGLEDRVVEGLEGEIDYLGGLEGVRKSLKNEGELSRFEEMRQRQFDSCANVHLQMIKKGACTN